MGDEGLEQAADSSGKTHNTRGERTDSGAVGAPACDVTALARLAALLTPAQIATLTPSQRSQIAAMLAGDSLPEGFSSDSGGDFLAFRAKGKVMTE